MPWPVALFFCSLALVCMAVACYWFAQTISVCRDLDRDVSPMDITRTSTRN